MRTGAALGTIVLLCCVDSAQAYRKTAPDNAIRPDRFSYSRDDGRPASEMDLEFVGTSRGPPGKQQDALLGQAMDAFKQASELETELKKSEEAVSAQTQELRKELAKAKATARTNGQSAYFKKEEKLDEQLMQQAEKETRRDRKLVAQAEQEMQGDKIFLVPLRTTNSICPHPRPPAAL